MKLFGIMSTVFGNDTAHTFGAIFDVDAKGVITGFTPVDFDGKKIYEWCDNSKGVHDPSLVPHTDSDKALLFPITDETAREMLVTMDYLHNGGSARFRMKGGYFPDPNFVRYARPSDAEGVVKTTCRDFLMNHLSRIGGVPIEAFSVDGEVMPAFESSWDMRDFIQMAAGMKGQECIGRLDGVMRDAGQGRLFYAYNGGGDLVTSLNQLPKDAQGRSVAQALLEDSQPFYDPARSELPNMRVHAQEVRTLASQPVEIEAVQGMSP